MMMKKNKESQSGRSRLPWLAGGLVLLALGVAWQAAGPEGEAKVSAESAGSHHATGHFSSPMAVDAGGSGPAAEEPMAARKSAARSRAELAGGTHTAGRTPQVESGREPASAQSWNPQGSVAGKSAGPMPAAEMPPALPVVFRFTDEELLASHPEVPPEVLDAIRQTFYEATGEGQLAPEDAEYRRRWQLAEPSAEERYRALFGWAAFAELQRKAALEAQTQTQGQTPGR